MKKIINGKLYDTDTARRLGNYDNGGSWIDFGHFEEMLYIKKTGEYFLYGEGGPMTRYAVATGTNSWSGGERIMPLTYDEAAAWAEEHLDADAFVEIFGPVPEGDDKKTVTFYLPVDLINQLKRDAQRAGISLSTHVEQLLTAKGAKKM